MFNFPSSSKSKGRSANGFMADTRASCTLPIPTRIMSSPPRLPLPQGLRVASAGHESDSFFESVTRSCGLLEQVESFGTATMSNSRLVPRSVSSCASSLTRSHAIRHGYTSSSSSLTSTSSNSSSSSSSSSSSHSSQISASCCSSSSTRRIRQERRKGAYFTKISIYREDRVEDCFVYAPSRVSTLNLDDFACIERQKEPDLAAPLEPRRRLSTVRTTRNVPQVVSLDHTRHTSHRASVCAGPEVPNLDAASLNCYEEDDEGEEEVLEDDESQDGYSRPPSSMSTRSDPFEYSAYLSRPACQKAVRSLSRASSVTIRPTKRDSVAPNPTSSPSPESTDAILPYSAYLSRPSFGKSECSLSRASSVTIRPTTRNSVVLTPHPSLPPAEPTVPIKAFRMGPPESVYAALRALQTMQAEKSFLFSENVEDMGDECLSDVNWTPGESSEVGLAL